MTPTPVPYCPLNFLRGSNFVCHRFSPAKHAKQTIVASGPYYTRLADRPTLEITTSGHPDCPPSTPTTPTVLISRLMYHVSSRFALLRHGQHSDNFNRLIGHQLGYNKCLGKCFNSVCHFYRSCISTPLLYGPSFSGPAFSTPPPFPIKHRKKLQATN